MLALAFGMDQDVVAACLSHTSTKPLPANITTSLTCLSPLLLQHPQSNIQHPTRLPLAQYIGFQPHQLYYQKIKMGSRNVKHNNVPEGYNGPLQLAHTLHDQLDGLLTFMPQL